MRQRSNEVEVERDVKVTMPDGVATVELDHRAISASSTSTASAHPFSITARVINNVLVARVPRNAFPLKIMWRRADGSVSETF